MVIKMNKRLNIIEKREKPMFDQNAPDFDFDSAFKSMCETCVPPSWENLFKNSKEELGIIRTTLKDQKEKFGEFFPLVNDIFNAFWLTKLETVKVVIIGQDPYYQLVNLNIENEVKQIPRAVGLSFSVRPEDTIPDSLVNIFKEIKRSCSDFRDPEHGDLSSWARQGVLLLNSCLTVRPGNPGSHKKIWFSFVKRVIDEIEKVNPNCIFVMWGEKAQSIGKFLNNKFEKLLSSHPSPLSVYRGFDGCNHFFQINEILQRQGKQPINWNLPTLDRIMNKNEFKLNKSRNKKLQKIDRRVACYSKYSNSKNRESTSRSSIKVLPDLNHTDETKNKKSRAPKTRNEKTPLKTTPSVQLDDLDDLINVPDSFMN